MDAALARGVLARSGALVTYQDQPIGHGRAAALGAQPWLAAEVEQRVRGGGAE